MEGTRAALANTVCLRLQFIATSSYSSFHYVVVVHDEYNNPLMHIIKQCLREDHMCVFVKWKLQTHLPDSSQKPSRLLMQPAGNEESSITNTTCQAATTPINN
ncbi:unnamed protein product [Trichobilharzia szidati]|nr:unnamed protein product [Trichobilharzia szidati]